jgi:hypothetical protein
LSKFQVLGLLPEKRKNIPKKSQKLSTGCGNC